MYRTLIWQFGASVEGSRCAGPVFTFWLTHKKGEYGEEREVVLFCWQEGAVDPPSYLPLNS